MNLQLFRLVEKRQLIQELMAAATDLCIPGILIILFFVTTHAIIAVKTGSSACYTVEKSPTQLHTG